MLMMDAAYGFYGMEKGTRTKTDDLFFYFIFYRI